MAKSFEAKRQPVRSPRAPKGTDCRTNGTKTCDHRPLIGTLLDRENRFGREPIAALHLQIGLTESSVHQNGAPKRGPSVPDIHSNASRTDLAFHIQATDAIVRPPPPTVHVDAITTLLPLRPAREDLGVAGHVELSRILDAPVVRAVATKLY